MHHAKNNKLISTTIHNNNFLHYHVLYHGGILVRAGLKQYYWWIPPQQNVAQSTHMFHYPATLNGNSTLATNKKRVFVLNELEYFICKALVTRNQIFRSCLVCSNLLYSREEPCFWPMDPRLSLCFVKVSLALLKNRFWMWFFSVFNQSSSCSYYVLIQI